MPEQPYTEADVQLVYDLLDPAGIYLGTRDRAVELLDAIAPRLVERGRRQATEGWEREWAMYLGLKGAPLHPWGSEAEARRGAAARAGRTVVSRLVGPWEPAAPTEPASVLERRPDAPTEVGAGEHADQPEPDFRPFAEEALELAVETFEAQKQALDDGQFQREILGMWPPDVEPARTWPPGQSPAEKLASLHAQPHGSRCTCRECDEQAEGGA